MVLFCNVTAGIGILEQASPMIQDYFDTVDAAAAAGFVGLLSLCQHERAVRLVLDVGRDRAQADLHGLPRDRRGPVLPPGLDGHRGRRRCSSLLTGVILSFYGGGFATVPAYLKDLFGDAAGRRDPRPAADRLVGRRHRRARLIVNAIADSQEAAGK